MRHRATLDVQGDAVDIDYRGEGRLVLLIHGPGTSSTAWHLQLDRLPGARRTAAPGPAVA